MSNKTFAKLLSIILSIAICATAVLGCLITVNAAEGPSYVITGAQCKKNDTVATATVDFAVPGGMAAGAFTIDNIDNWYESVSVELASNRADANDNISIDVLDGNVLFNITDGSGTSKLYTSISFELSFEFASPITSDINITVSDLDFSGLYGENYTEFTATNGKFTAGCIHVYSVSGDPVYTDVDNGYAVYSSAVCTLCGEAKSGYQVKPVVKSNGIVSTYTTEEPDVSLLDETQPNSESNPYIIESANQMYMLCRVALKHNGTTIDTNGAYFKVADGIKAFYLNGGETVAAMTTPEQIKEYFEVTNTGAKKVWAGNVFKGHFDGNGVEIYGLRSEDGIAGLFPKVDGNVTIKNVTIKNSYLKGSNYVGAIVGQGWTTDGTSYAITVENVAVINNYIAYTGGNSAFAGVVIGYVQSNKMIATNVIAYGNGTEYTNTSDAEGMPLFSYTSSTENKFTNIVSIGHSLEGNSWYTKAVDNGMYVNVWSDKIGNNTNYTAANGQKYNLNIVTPEQMQGATAAVTTAETTAANKAARDANSWPFFGADLDWNTSENPDGVWFVGKSGQYPTLVKGFELDAANSTDVDWSLLATNIAYEDDGSFALNFHYLAPYESDDMALYVPKANTANGFIKITESTDSPFADGNILPVGTKMFTIPQLSARDIQTKWLPTIITTADYGSEKVYGKTEVISIADVAISVLNGEAYYGNSATAEQKQADVNVAAAVLNYSDAVNSISNVLPEVGVSEYTGSENAEPFTTGDGTEGNPFIVESADQLAVIVQGKIETEGLYFKVSDNVRAFYINGGEKVANMTSAAEVKAYFTANPGKVWWTPSSESVSEYFKGNFDGNGVVISGLYTGSAATGNAQGSAALFPKTGAGAVIKNVTVKNSYIEGLIAGGIVASGYDTNETGHKLTLENIVVVNNYIRCLHTSAAAFGGVVYAYTQNYAAEVTNCVVYGNDASYANFTAEMPVFSYSNASGLNKFYYIVSIGHSLQGNSWHTKAIDNGMYQWVYSDRIDENTNYSGGQYNAQYNINVLEPEQMLGSVAMANMPLLDWSNIWAYGAEGQPPVLALRKNVTKKTVNWDGTFYTDVQPAKGSGTEQDPYIISDAKELATIVNARVDTTDKYYKVSDEISAFYMNGGETVANMSSVEEVKTYFEANPGKAWWTSGLFKGHFDGNGATVYGLYACKERAGLFTNIGANAVIKNITVKNSYMKAGASTTATYAGGIAGQVEYYSGISTSNKTTIENCGVINTYIDNTHLSSNPDAGVIMSMGREHQIIVNNFLAYGNKVVSTSGNPGALIGSTWNANNKISNVLSLDTCPYSVAQANGSKPSVFTNVYTNVDLTAGEAVGGGAYTEDQIKRITAEQAMGPNADDVITGFAWDDIWFTGGIGDYPAFEKAGIMPSSLQSVYDAMILDNYDSYGEGTNEFGVYSTSLSLKTNPYIGFTFAFHLEYRDNRDKITVKFTTSDGTTYTTVPETDGKLNENWVNNEGAVRYHLYRFKDVPVKYLCDDITVTVNYNGKDYNFGTFSAEGFALNAMNANAKVPCDYYTSRAEAAKALLFYSQMLKVRYGA